MRNLHCSYDFSNSHSKSNSAKHLMGGACLKPGFWIRTGLTVQLHQILPISRRRQGLYKDCPHHRDNAFHCPLMVFWTYTCRLTPKTLTHTPFFTSYEVFICIYSLFWGKQMWEFNHRTAFPSLPTARACLNTARWTHISNVMRII